MEKLLSIIVPTYNVENYLGQCLDSLCMKKTNGKMEVLIINDGSTDSSADIARGYIRNHPEVFRLINKENGGHGSAINRGIQEAEGKYFKVVDSDDWVDAEALDRLLSHLESSASDVVYTNFYHVDNRSGRKTVEFARPFPEVEYGREYHFSELKNNFFLKMHGYTIRTELLKNIPQIDEHCFYVDMEYVLFPVPQIETITFLDIFVYQYRIGLPGQSMSIQKMKRNANDYDRVLGRVLNFYSQWAPKLPPEKLGYMEHVLGRMAASRIKIYLSQPYSRSNRKAIEAFEDAMRRNYPAVYQAVGNKAVLLLRRSRYRLYMAARAAYYWKERLS